MEPEEQPCTCDHIQADTVSHTIKQTERPDKENPADRETITTQRASETHLTLFNIYQEIRK